VANNFQNSDLFWALRGGGGGSWGVVLNATIRTFPDPPVAVQSLTVSTANYTGFWKFVEEFHAQLPAVDDAGGSGYYFLSSAAAGNVSNIRIALFFVGHTNETAMAKVMDPLIQYANEILGSSSVVSLRSQAPAFKYVIDVLLPSDSDTGGGIARIGSRLVSRRLLSRRTGAAALMDSFKQFFALGVGAGATITGHVVAGGQVARNARLDVAVNPAWRRTLTHLSWGLSWPSTATVEEQRAVERRITDVVVPLFSRLEPDMGAYLNEADASERDFQRSFWGDNYPRLRKVKKRWDPEGIFITRKGVGSEDWDEDGLCRVQRCG
jgi:FAD/FMN-containing dehydrogenase